MIFGILPVKSPRQAKQRLSALLTEAQREILARAMYEEMLEKMCAARGIDRIAVITSDEIAARRAQRAGVLVFEESRQLGHSHSADDAARRAMEIGAQTVVLLPIDVPLATSSEIDALAGAACPGVLIVPSADGSGTNALVRTPPDVIQSCFGPNSLRAHLEQARARGVYAEIVRPPGIVFDVDTPEDVAELLDRAPDCRVAGLLKSRWASKS